LATICGKTDTGLTSFVSTAKAEFKPTSNQAHDIRINISNSEELSGVLVYADFYNDGETFDFENKHLNANKSAVRQSLTNSSQIPEQLVHLLQSSDTHSDLKFDCLRSLCRLVSDR